LQKVAEYQGHRSQAQAAIRETEGRIQALEEQQSVTQPRLVTQVRTSEPPVVQQLKAVLLNLELKHTEMLASFSPEYRPVLDLAKQIEQTRAALEAEQNKPVREEVTDRDTTYQWLSSELAKNRSELVSIKEREAALGRLEQHYENRARRLDEKDTGQQDSLLEVKTAQDNYLLYLRKEEEARISEALDHQRIVNVAVAEAPTTPSSPTNPRTAAVVLGILLAIMVSSGLALLFDYLDPSFRTPDEVEMLLHVPVVAAVPDHGPRGYVPQFVQAALSDDDYRALAAP
jgi:uncharacterized protein involved in exopolysaccharide biosynthesis